jgi:N-acetylmuramoyl-L-alanine amidase
LRRAYKKAIIVPLAAAIISSGGITANVALAAPEPLKAGFEGFRAMVLGDVCNVRARPDTNSQVLGTVTQGTSLTLLGFQNNWAKISFQGKEGWIAGWLIDIDLRSAGVIAKVTHTDVNLRQGPGTEYGVKGMTQKGNVYPAEAKRGMWIRVSLPGGEAAWISEGLVLLQVDASTATSPPPPVTYEGDLVVYPTKDRVNVTQSPVVGSTAVGRLNRGESAKLIDSVNGWLVVELTGGTRGWVNGAEARVATSKDPTVSLSVSGSTWTIGKYPTVTVTASDVNFRSGAGTSYPVIGMLQKGNVLRVVEKQGDWIKAVSPNGVTGWVAGWLTSGISGAGASQFAVTAEAGKTARTLTVTGPFDSAVVIPSSDGKSVLVSTSTFLNADASLPVNSYEFGTLKVSGSDVTLSYQGEASYFVKTNVAGKVVLEFRPSVTSVDLKANGAGDILTINTVGYAEPSVVRNGNSVKVSLPGASYTGSVVSAQGQLVKAVAVQSGSSSTDVVLTIDQNTPYLIKKVGNSIEAHIGVPGLTGKRIVVDPGHETDDPGAIGPTGLSERNVNWEIAQRLVNLLRAAGADAVLTRSGLYSPSEAPSDWTPRPHEYSGSLAKRAAWSIGADLFISIHNDSNADRNVCGTAVYVCDGMLNSAESRRFANLVLEDLTAAIGTQSHGVKSSELYVVRESSSPAVLIETMFISNPREESYLRLPATWDKAAAGILKAVQRYFAPAN